MSKMPPWSYSALEGFETCPRRFYHLRVARTYNEEQTEAIRWGNTVHKALELRLGQGTPLPSALQHLEPMAKRCVFVQGRRLVEQRFAVNAAFAPVGWRDPSAWCRGIADYGLVGADTGVALDWKTGNRKPQSGQLKLMAALMFSHYPYVQTTTTGFVWLKDRKVDADKFTRQQVGSIWSEFVPKVRRLETAYQVNSWPAKPSGLCKKWCPVTRQHCEHGK